MSDLSASPRAAAASQPWRTRQCVVLEQITQNDEEFFQRPEFHDRRVTESLKWGAKARLWGKHTVRRTGHVLQSYLKPM